MSRCHLSSFIFCEFFFYKKLSLLSKKNFFMEKANKKEIIYHYISQFIFQLLNKLKITLFYVLFSILLSHGASKPKFEYFIKANFKSSKKTKLVTIGLVMILAMTNLG